LNYLDLFIIVVLGVAFILGYRDGVIKKAIGAAGFFLAVYLAYIFADDAGALFQELTGVEPYLSKIIAAFVVFIGVMFAFSGIAQLAKPRDEVNGLINRIAGGAVGVLQFVVFLSALFYIGAVFGFPEKEDRDQSTLYDGVAGAVPRAIQFLGEHREEAKQFLPESSDEPSEPKP
jgi:membrane protein required for colicin V production